MTNTHTQPHEHTHIQHRPARVLYHELSTDTLILSYTHTPAIESGTCEHSFSHSHPTTHNYVSKLQDISFVSLTYALFYFSFWYSLTHTHTESQPHTRKITLPISLFNYTLFAFLLPSVVIILIICSLGNWGRLWCILPRFNWPLTQKWLKKHVKRKKTGSPDHQNPQPSIYMKNVLCTHILVIIYMYTVL